jgi:hypothetical protein
MHYKFLSLEEGGNGLDFIMVVERQPTLWQWLMGHGAEMVEYFGPRPYWVTMEGMIAPPPVQRTLDRYWKTHLPKNADWRTTVPWNRLEPAGPR